MENQNQTPPIELATENTSNPVVPDPVKPTSNFSMLMIIGIIMFFILTGSTVAAYFYRDSIVSMIVKPTPSPIVSISPSPTSKENIQSYKGDGFTFNIPEGYTQIEGADGVEFHRPSGFGLTILKSQSTPYEIPSDSTNLKVTSEKIKLDTIETLKYTTTATGTELDKDEFVYFKTKSMYYQLMTNIDAGGMSINAFIATFKFSEQDPTPTLKLLFDCDGRNGCICYSDNECISKICKKETPDTANMISSGKCSQ